MLIQYTTTFCSTRGRTSLFRNIEPDLAFAAWTLFMAFFKGGGLQPPANHPLNGARTYANVFFKPPFVPDFISQL